MATLATLLNTGVVTRIEVALDGGLPWREIYAFPEVGQPNFLLPWLSALSSMSSIMGAEDTPEEQVYGLLELYAQGEPLILGEMYKPLHPHPDGIWEFKTVDTRIFGWFCHRDHFIAVFGDDATKIHTHNLHHGYINEVIRLRNTLDLDMPKFVPGANPDDVLSVRPKPA